MLTFDLLIVDIKLTHEIIITVRRASPVAWAGCKVPGGTYLLSVASPGAIFRFMLPLGETPDSHFCEFYCDPSQLPESAIYLATVCLKISANLDFVC